MIFFSAVVPLQYYDGLVLVTIPLTIFFMTAWQLEELESKKFNFQNGDCLTAAWQLGRVVLREASAPAVVQLPPQCSADIRLSELVCCRLETTLTGLLYIHPASLTPLHCHHCWWLHTMCQCLLISFHTSQILSRQHHTTTLTSLKTLPANWIRLKRHW